MHPSPGFEQGQPAIQHRPRRRVGMQQAALLVQQHHWRPQAFEHLDAQHALRRRPRERALLRQGVGQMAREARAGGEFAGVQRLAAEAPVDAQEVDHVAFLAQLHAAHVAAAVGNEVLLVEPVGRHELVAELLPAIAPLARRTLDRTLRPRIDQVVGGDVVEFRFRLLGRAVREQEAALAQVERTEVDGEGRDGTLERKQRVDPPALAVRRAVEPRHDVVEDCWIHWLPRSMGRFAPTLPTSARPRKRRTRAPSRIQPAVRLNPSLERCAGRRSPLQ